MNRINNNVEILAPAGSFESLIGAVKSGCDAVYLGGKSFSARATAVNFSDEEIIEAVRYCHLRGVRLYVTMNILISDNEMEDAVKYAKFLHENKVDAIIVQDPGFAYYVKKKIPDIELHASTQMTINNYYGARLLEIMGFTRVVVARETPLWEIKRIKEETNLEVEHFVHGALCVSYSGQCLMSSMIGGRSGNRGACAQPCRKGYDLIDFNGEKVKNANGKYVISPKDLNTIENIKDIINYGVDSLKIEGRMKRPEYVIQVVRAYKKAIEDNIEKDDKENVEQIFNRGFTKGLFLGDFGQNFISQDRPDNKGVLVGEVILRTKKGIKAKFNKKLNKGDGIEFTLEDDSVVGYTVKENFKEGKEVFIPTNLKVKPSSKIRRTSSIELIESLKNSEDETNLYPITVYGKFKKDEKAYVTFSYNKYSVEIESSDTIETAEKKGVTKEKIETQLNKLKDTVFFIDKIELEIDDNIFLSLSQINEMRRKAVELLEVRILEEITNNKKVKKSKIKEIVRNKIEDEDILSIELRTKDQIKKIDFSKIDRIYLPYGDEIDEMLSYTKNRNIEVWVYFNKIMESDDLNLAFEKLNLYKEHIYGLRADNLGTLMKIMDSGFENISCGIGLNIFNSKSVELMKDLGLKSLFLSPELKSTQIQNLKHKEYIEQEMIVYGKLPVMTMKHCPMSLVKGCGNDRNCKSCNFAKGYSLKDSRNTVFQMNRIDDFTEIYNAHPIFLLEKINNLKDLGINSFNILLTTEVEEIEEIINNYYEVIKKNRYSNGTQDLREVLVEKYGNITYGHLYRGVI